MSWGYLIIGFDLKIVVLTVTPFACVQNNYCMLSWITQVWKHLCISDNKVFIHLFWWINDTYDFFIHAAGRIPGKHFSFHLFHLFPPSWQRLYRVQVSMFLLSLHGSRLVKLNIIRIPLSPRSFFVLLMRLCWKPKGTGHCVRLYLLRLPSYSRDTITLQQKLSLMYN